MEDDAAKVALRSGGSRQVDELLLLEDRLDRVGTRGPRPLCRVHAEVSERRPNGDHYLALQRVVALCLGEASRALPQLHGVHLEGADRLDTETGLSLDRLELGGRTYGHSRAAYGPCVCRCLDRRLYITADRNGPHVFAAPHTPQFRREPVDRAVSSHVRLP